MIEVKGTCVRICGATADIKTDFSVLCKGILESSAGISKEDLIECLEMATKSKEELFRQATEELKKLLDGRDPDEADGILADIFSKFLASKFRRQKEEHDDKD